MSKAKLGLIALVLVLVVAAAGVVVANFGAITDFVGSLFGNSEDDPPASEYPEDDIPLEGLVLISKNYAHFNVITAQGAGTAGIRAANNLVNTLKGFGVDINSAIADSNDELIYDYEIIIGTGCRGRGDECNISARELGPDGYVIKVVGKRVVIAGGTAAKTRDTVELFMREYLGITETTESLRNKAISETLNVVVHTDYNIDSIKIGDINIADYTIVCDQNGFGLYPSLTSAFQDTLATVSGTFIECVDESNAGNIQNQIVFRTLPLSVDADGNRTYADGFYVRTEGTKLIFECEYENAFVTEFDNFVETYITSKEGDVVIPGDLSYTKNVSIVKYSDFGAVGDGVTDDFSAILRAHEYANLGRQKVVADGEAYYIGMGGKQIPIKTFVEWGTSRFIVDDTAKGVDRRKHIFLLARENNKKTLLGVNLKAEGVTDTSLKSFETTSIPWLKDYLEAPSLLVIKNGGHKDYVRYGSNSNNGYDRCDVILVDKDGNVDPSTPITFDYTEVTQIEIIRIDDAPITVSGGFFENICCRSNCKHTDAEGCYKGRKNPDGVSEKYCRSNAYQSFSRGIRIERANATVMNVDHKVVDEPEDGSYPYYGFLLFYNAYNVTIKDCNLTGHKKYCEYKTNSEGATNWVWMGTYDFVVEYSNEIHFEGVTQTNGKNDIGDNGYWGIMSSNFSKNLYFKECVISRIDAHMGFWNMTVEDCVVGHTFNVIGGGTLTVKNTERRVGDSFISLRGDYGATFNGDIKLTNCLLDGFESYDTVWGGASGRPETRCTEGYIIKSGFQTNTKYLNWDFGYTCYLPTTVTIENFVSNTGSTYVFEAIGNAAFKEDTKNRYQLTNKVTYITNNSIELPAFLEGKNITTTKSKIGIATGGSTLAGVLHEEKTVNAE